MLYGALAGDISGSRFEFANIKTKCYDLFSPGCRFTDDSVMTFAVALACEQYKSHKDPERFKEELIDFMHDLGNAHIHAGYGGRFYGWLTERSRKPYNSWGNGSAMRVSPVAYYCSTLEETLMLAKASAQVTHNHPEGIKGAQAVAACVFMALQGKDKHDIKEYINENFYKLDFTVDEIRPTYHFDVSCQGSVPQALQCFFESTDFEDAIRNAVSIGGDCDTTACIAGGIAEAYYGVNDSIKKQVLSYMTADLAQLIDRFN